jgi:hypothetical protein
MSAGRSFADVDEMTLFDLQMMGEYRRDNPELEDMVALLLEWTGAWKRPARSQPEPPSPKSLPDPRADIARAFAGIRFSDKDKVDLSWLTSQSSSAVI